MPELVLKMGDQVVQTFVFDKDVMSVGRSRDNDIVIENLSVSRNHARVRKADHKYVLTDLNSANGTYVNGVRVTKTEIEHDDVISIGKHKLMFLNPMVNEERALVEALNADRTIMVDRTPGPSLIVTDGRMQNQEFPLTKFETSIGRGSGNDVVLTDDWLLGKKQAVIVRKGNLEYELHDMGGFKKSKVNGVGVSAPTVLKPGDVIEFGHARCVFQFTGNHAKPTGRVPQEILGEDSLAGPGAFAAALAAGIGPGGEVAADAVAIQPGVQAAGAGVAAGAGAEPEAAPALAASVAAAAAPAARPMVAQSQSPPTEVNDGLSDSTGSGALLAEVNEAAAAQGSGAPAPAPGYLTGTQVRRRQRRERLRDYAANAGVSVYGGEAFEVPKPPKEVAPLEGGIVPEGHVVVPEVAAARAAAVDSGDGRFERPAKLATEDGTASGMQKLNSGLTEVVTSAPETGSIPAEVTGEELPPAAELPSETAAGLRALISDDTAAGGDPATIDGELGGAAKTPVPVIALPPEELSDDPQIALWQKALQNKSPVIRKQAAKMLKKLTGKDYAI